MTTRTTHRKRNRGFEETHQALIETAVKLISEKGVEALSIAALAREVGLNRTTIYYHFPSRDVMLKAVKDWSSVQLAKGMELEAPQLDRMAAITDFVLENPDLIKLWIDDFIATGDIRERYPRWDALVSGMSRTFAEKSPGEEFDAEVYCTMMLASAIIGPRIFQHSVAPDSDPDEIRARFMAEQRRVLERDHLLR
jgi:AcrR family transcriptional regulator